MARGGRDQVISGFLKGLGRALVRARRDAGLTQEEAAERLYPHVRSVQTISTWENGWNKPAPENFHRLCAVYRVAPEELMRDVYRSLAQEGDRTPADIEGLEPLVARELARLPRELQRDLVFRWLPLATELGARIAKSRTRYAVKSQGSEGDGEGKA
jgi:transcriptional regulator with XRE-family HTH domain